MDNTNHNQSHRLLEATEAELVEAAERADAGLRLAFPMMFDGMGADPVPEPVIDDTVIGHAADTVAAFRDDAMRELHRLDKHAPRHIHVEALKVVAQCDDFLMAVASYFRDGRS